MSLSARSIATQGLSAPLLPRLIGVQGLWSGSLPNRSSAYIPGLTVRHGVGPGVSAQRMARLNRDDDDLMLLLSIALQSGALE